LVSASYQEKLKFGLNQAFADTWNIALGPTLALSDAVVTIKPITPDRRILPSLQAHQNL